VRPASGLYLVALLACGGGGGQAPGGGEALAQPVGTWPALPRRVTVQVRNAGGHDGGARAATLQLRAGGLDVVLFDDAPPALRDPVRRTHRILVRRGDTLGVGRIIELLGPAEVEEAPDASVLVDLTVLVARPAPADTTPPR
jgi:hypothetical protein